MSARSTVTIYGFATRIHLYRHYDGGPWGNGVAICRALKQLGDYDYAKAPHTLSGLLLATGDYEITRDAADHGDREWHYDVWFTEDGLHPAIRVRFRNWESGSPYQNHNRWGCGYAGGSGFRRYVAEYLMGMRKRIHEYRDRKATA